MDTSSTIKLCFLVNECTCRARTKRQLSRTKRNQKHEITLYFTLILPVIFIWDSHCERYNSLKNTSRSTFRAEAFSSEEWPSKNGRLRSKCHVLLVQYIFQGVECLTIRNYLTIISTYTGTHLSTL